MFSDRVFKRAGTPSLKDAGELALHNARTLGGVWWVWSHTEEGHFYVTCQGLVGGLLFARTSYGQAGEEPILINFED